MKKILLIFALIIAIFQSVVLATAIDIGNPALEKSSVGAGWTYVDRNNSANETGTITSIEVWVKTSTTNNVEVATFFVVSGNNLSTRDTEALGNLTAGYHQIDVNLDVTIGDYIGVFSSGGDGVSIDTSTAATGMWYNTTDRIPCTNVTFTALANYTISLYGTGATEEEEEANAIFFGTNF